MPSSKSLKHQAVRNATMADVAKLAGVGKMTVSRLLSGSAHVSKETAARVHRAIRKLNYQPNELARSLRSVHTKTIALILPYLYDPFFATCAHGVSQVAAENGYSVLITTTDEQAETEQQQVRQMLRRRIDGMVIIPAPQTDNYLGAEELSRVHVVSLDRPAPSAHFDSVTVNNRAGARLGVEHLIEHGHRRIAFLGLSKALYTMQSRYAGYSEAMEAAGLAAGDYMECASPEQTVQSLQSALAQAEPSTALFAANNLTMRYLLHALNALHVDVPGDVALAGFDDFDIADVLQPALTVVRQPAFQMGEKAAQLLFQRIARGELPSKGDRVVLPVELVVRRSCGCAVQPAESDAQASTPLLASAAL